MTFNLSSDITTTTEFLAWRRAEFLVFEHKIFLTHASISPLPARAARAIAEYSQRISREGQFDYIHQKNYEHCKERLAALVGGGARPEEIAFAGSTSHAIGLVATSLPWQAGDNCVVADGDFPANVVTWKNLQHTHDVEVRTIPPRGSVMNLEIEDIEPLIDEKTRVVSLASANFLSGYPLDLNRIGRWLHARGVLLCVDAIQTLGAIQFDAENVDFVCADAHKWLLGPNGIAFMWARGEVLETMRPAILGWLAVKEREDWFQYDTTPFPTAERFEPGARNYLGVLGMEASLSVIQDAGLETVQARVVALRDYTATKLEECGCRVLWMPTADKPSGIVSFQAANGETEKLYQRLDEKFALSIRTDRNGEFWIRVSPHFMNTAQDIDELIAALRVP